MEKLVQNSLRLQIASMVYHEAEAIGIVVKFLYIADVID